MVPRWCVCVYVYGGVCPGRVLSFVSFPSWVAVSITRPFAFARLAVAFRFTSSFSGATVVGWCLEREGCRCP